MLPNHAHRALDDIQLINHKTVLLLSMQKDRLASGEVSIFEADSDLPEDFKKEKLEAQIKEIEDQIANAERAIAMAEEVRTTLPQE